MNRFQQQVLAPSTIENTLIRETTDVLIEVKMKCQ